MTRSTRRRVQWLAIILGAIALTLSGADVRAGTRNCHPAWKCAPATATPHPTPSSTPRPTPTQSPTPTSSGYTFDDEFSGTTLGSVWQHHYHCCGTVTMDPSLSSVSGGYLHQIVVNRSGAWYADILDTKTTFTQNYGYFEARIKVARGKGFWPAFWLYNDAANGGDEIDTMEVCANPIGANGGNDVTLLHTTVHKGTQATQVGAGYRTGDLSLAFHTYAVDWRPTYVAFYLDGVQVFRETSLAIATSKALLMNFGVGGSWCSSPDATTPSGAEQLVDWVRVRP